MYNTVAKNSSQNSSDVQSGPSGVINCEIVFGRGQELWRHWGP